MNRDGAQLEEMRCGRWKKPAPSPGLIRHGKQASLCSFTLCVHSEMVPQTEHEARACMWVVYLGK